MTDNGSCYQAFTFRDACRDLGIKHIRTKPPRTPATSAPACSPTSRPERRLDRNRRPDDRRHARFRVFAAAGESSILGKRLTSY
jgi:transposase InsO family protein